MVDVVDAAGAARTERRMQCVTPILHEAFADPMPATASVDVLIPTYGRPAALAVTLTALTAQTFRDFRVVISDQHESEDAASAGEVQAVLRVLEARGHHVEIHKHLPRRGMAEQRQFLLDCADARYVLFLDDDVISNPISSEDSLRRCSRPAADLLAVPSSA